MLYLCFRFQKLSLSVNAQRARMCLTCFVSGFVAQMLPVIA